VIHAFYEDVFAEIMERLREIKGVPFKLFVTTPLAQGEKIDAVLNPAGSPTTCCRLITKAAMYCRS